MYDLKIQKMNLAMQLIFHSISFPQTNFDRSFFGILNNRVWDEKKIFKKKYKSFWELRVPRMFPIQSIQHGKDLSRDCKFFHISICTYIIYLSLYNIVSTKYIYISLYFRLTLWMVFPQTWKEIETKYENGANRTRKL